MNYLKYQQDMLSAWNNGTTCYYEEDMDYVWLCFDGAIAMRMPIDRCGVDFRRICIEKKNLFSALYNRAINDIHRSLVTNTIDFTGYIFLDNQNGRVFQKGCYSKYFSSKDGCHISGKRDPIIYIAKKSSCRAIVMPINPATVPKEYGGERE